MSPSPSRIPALSLAAALLAGIGASGALAQNLTIGIGGSPTALDPHFYNASPNISLTQHMFDRLVEQDAEARLQPMLAQSWRPISDTVWEFKLRPGVKWHDGRDFTAEDVVFTIERVPNVRNSPGTFAGMIRAITRAEIIDPLTIRFHTAAPHPLLPTELASVQIISRHAGGGAETEDYNSGRRRPRITIPAAPRLALAPIAWRITGKVTAPNSPGTRITGPGHNPGRGFPTASSPMMRPVPQPCWPAMWM